MKTFSVSLSILFGTVFMLVRLGVASAGSIFTPIIFLGGGNQILCVANNVSGETIRVMT